MKSRRLRDVLLIEEGDHTKREMKLNEGLRLFQRVSSKKEGHTDACGAKKAYRYDSNEVSPK